MYVVSCKFQGKSLSICPSVVFIPMYTPVYLKKYIGLYLAVTTNGTESRKISQLLHPTLTA